MADSCTYADLRFVKATPGPAPEASSTVCTHAGEHMYANVTNSEGGSRDRASRKYTGRDPSKLQGGTSFSNHITIILAVSFLITLVTCIGLGVQLFQVSKDRDILETHFLQKIQMQNKSMENTEKRSWETEQKLEKAKDKLENIQEDIDYVNSSWYLTQKKMEESNQELLKCLKSGRETEDRLDKSEGTLNGIKELFKGHEDAEYCQKGWNLLAGTCLNLSVTEKSIKESKQACKSMGAWSIGSKIRDPAVKEFMNNWKENKYWVGLRTNNYEYNWKDTSSPKFDLNSYDICGVTQRGYLQQHPCHEHSKNLFICEKDPMKIKLINGLPAVLQMNP